MYVERRAGLGSVVAVAVDGSVREPFPQVGDQTAKGCALLGRARVFGSARRVQSSDVANADAAGIMV